MSARGLLWIVLLVSLVVGCASPPGVALVVGNGDYPGSSALANPPRDARGISRELSRVGWDVTTLIDRPRTELDAAVRDFARAIERTDQALFYYAGHGMQVGGENYLVPIDFVPSDVVLNRDLVAVTSLIEHLSADAPQLVVILDACRNNPLALRLRESGAIRGVVFEDLSPGADLVVGDGLAEVRARSRTLIAFSTQPGHYALDGDGEHSPFTGALLDHLTERNKDIQWILRRVREDVMSLTSDEQVPWDHSSLTGDFIVHPLEVDAPAP